MGFHREHREVYEQTHWSMWSTLYAFFEEVIPLAFGTHQHQTQESAITNTATHPTQGAICRSQKVPGRIEPRSLAQALEAPLAPGWCLCLKLNDNRKISILDMILRQLCPAVIWFPEMSLPKQGWNNWVIKVLTFCPSLPVHVVTGKRFGMLGHGRCGDHDLWGTAVNGGPWHLAKIPQVQSLEPSQTGICRTISGMWYCWESCRQAAICVTGSWKSSPWQGPSGSSLHAFCLTL